jgi:hypothetical protein
MIGSIETSVKCPRNSREYPGKSENPRIPDAVVGTFTKKGKGNIG